MTKERKQEIINTFDLISSDNLLIEEEALTMLEEVLK